MKGGSELMDWDDIKKILLYIAAGILSLVPFAFFALLVGIVNLIQF